MVAAVRDNMEPIRDPEIARGRVDAAGKCANLVTPRDRGTPLIGSSFYVHLGLQIGLNFVPVL